MESIGSGYRILKTVGWHWTPRELGNNSDNLEQGVRTQNFKNKVVDTRTLEQCQGNWESNNKRMELTAMRTVLWVSDVRKHGDII